MKKDLRLDDAYRFAISVWGKHAAINYNPNRAEAYRYYVGWYVDDNIDTKTMHIMGYGKSWADAVRFTQKRIEGSNTSSLGVHTIS